MFIISLFLIIPLTWDHVLNCLSVCTCGWVHKVDKMIDGLVAFIRYITVVPWHHNIGNKVAADLFATSTIKTLLPPSIPPKPQCPSLYLPRLYFFCQILICRFQLLSPLLPELDGPRTIGCIHLCGNCSNPR